MIGLLNSRLELLGQLLVSIVQHCNVLGFFSLSGLLSNQASCQNLIWLPSLAQSIYSLETFAIRMQSDGVMEFPIYGVMEFPLCFILVL